MHTSARPPASSRRAASFQGSRAAGGGRAGVGPAWVWLVPVSVALVLYARTFGYAFVWDDLDLIVRNVALQGPRWAALLTQDFWQSTGGGTGMWRPLVTTTFRLAGVLSDWQPWAFHLVNVALHATASALVARLALARSLPAWAALGAGLVYATAPALAESTAWISGSADAWVALSSLLALTLARRWREQGSTIAALGTLACVGVALLAKESALVLPLLLAADAADAARAARTRRWRPALASLALVGAWGLAHRALVAAPAHPATPGAAAGLAALVWAHLAWLLPGATHSPLLELWRAPGAVVSGAAWAGLALVSVGVAVAIQRRMPVVLVPALVFAPLLPVAAASLLESGVRFAERSLALPAAGLALGLAMLAAQSPARARLLAGGALAVWVVLQALAVWPAVAAWRDDESRIRRIAQVRPRDPDALLGLADLLSSLGRGEEARVWIARAESASPASAGPLVARASIEFRGGRFEQALAAAEQALAREGEASDALAAGVIRVRALARLGRAREAVAAGEHLVAARPDEAAARGALGVARFAGGDAQGALEPLAFASERLIDDAGLAWDLGRAAVAAGDIALARVAFERAVATAPEFYEAWLGVADTRARLGDAAGAAQALQSAARLPGAADGRVELLRARVEQR